jgi:hypothetical protein
MRGTTALSHSLKFCELEKRDSGYEIWNAVESGAKI